MMSNSRATARTGELSGTALVIEATGLHKSYGDQVAVSDLSISVEAGQVLGLLGPNGAGKTTTVNMLTTLLPIDSGAARVAGFDVTSEARSVRTVIGLAGQSAAVDVMLTARENLKVFGRLYKIPRAELAERIETLIERFRMTDYADRPVSTLSGGQRRRLDVVAALIADPPALFLDEPTTGLDPRSRSEIWEAIESLAEAGTAIVLTTQYLEEADRLADQIVMIDRGAVVAAGTPIELKQQLERDVLEIHLDGDQDLAEVLLILGQIPGVTSNPETREIHVPVGGGAGALAMLRRLDDAGIVITDFQLRRPTLDDVFLTLTDPTE
ncbi:MAG: ATP-binding cassette domain-containing protein [Acidimicrobiia bacterium]|jgi:ABC-2 type transport system ATP-binding protein